MILPQTENGTDHNIICSLYLISTTLAIITYRWQLCAEQYATWIDSCNLFLSLYIYMQTYIELHDLIIKKSLEHVLA